MYGHLYLEYISEFNLNTSTKSKACTLHTLCKCACTQNSPRYIMIQEVSINRGNFFSRKSAL